MISRFLVLCATFSSILAQLSLPQSPWLPPDASTGASPSSGGVPNPQWSTLLGDLLYFYDAQRSGHLPDTNRVSWRNDSALDDGKDVGLDLTGGYYDAGDYVKFTYPLSFSLMSICWGALDFGHGYDMSNQTAYLDSMLRWGLDWMIKAHPSDHTLYVQVGDSNVDNAYWGGDRSIPTPRLSYQINDTHPGTDSAASASAAFSACSLLYNPTDTPSILVPAKLQNISYASTLLKHAISLHNFAVNATSGQTTTQTSVPAVADAYSSSGYGDDLALSALFLAWTSNSSSLYQDAEGYYAKYKLGGQDDVFNWDDRSPGLAVLFSQVISAAPGVTAGASKKLSDWKSEAESYFDRIVNGKSRGQLTKGGLLYYPGDSDSNSLNPALNAAMLMRRYAGLATSDDKRNTYLSFAQSQLNYALGDNPMSAPYVVGVNPNSPRNPHSAISSGGSDIGNINTSPPEEAYILYGASVGGPDKNDLFWDLRSDWVQGEVALDYNAPLLTLVAAQIMNNGSDPFYTRLQAGAYQTPKGQPCDASTSCDQNSVRFPRVGQIVIGVVISVVGIVIFGLLVYWLIHAHQNRTLSKA